MDHRGVYKYVTSARVDAIEAKLDRESLEATYNTMNGSSTLISGGIMTINGSDSTKIDISAGEGVIIKHIHDGAVSIDNYYHVPVTWDAITTSIDGIGTRNITHVSLDVDGKVVFNATKPDFNMLHDHLQLGVAVHVNRANVDTINHAHGFFHFSGAQFADFMLHYGMFNTFGNLFRPKFGAAPFLHITKTPGELYYPGIGYHLDQDNPNVQPLPGLDPATFQYRFNDGSSEPGPYTLDIDPVHLDDGAGGKVTMAGNLNWSIQHIYSFTSNNVKIQRGVKGYKDFKEASAAVNNEPGYIVEASIADNGILRGILIINKACTDLEDTNQAVFLDPVNARDSVTPATPSDATLQSAYDNAIGPYKIGTTTALGPVCVRTVDDSTEKALCVEGSTGTEVFEISGEGRLVCNNLAAERLHLHDQPTFIARVDTSGQSIPDATSTTVIFQVVQRNTGGFVVNGSNQIVVPENGLYQINCQVEVDLTTLPASESEILIFVSWAGSSTPSRYGCTRQVVPGGTTQVRWALSTSIAQYFTAGATINPYVSQNTGTPQRVSTHSWCSSRLSVFKIH